VTEHPTPTLRDSQNRAVGTATVIRGNARHLVKEMPAKSLIGIPWRYILRTWEDRRQP
jgi:hypothetical protein